MLRAVTFHLVDPHFFAMFWWVLRLVKQPEVLVA
jgi:hypothetical protein